MDESNSKEVGKKFLEFGRVKELEETSGTLGTDAKTQLDQFIENNVTMANNWIGASGDSFLYSANTLAAFLAGTLKFYEVNQDLLSQYSITFQDIDKHLMEVAGIEEN